MLTFFDNICIFVSLFTDKKYLIPKLFKISCQFVHFALKLLIIQTDKIKLITAISKSFYIRRSRLIHFVLRYP